MNKWFDSKVFAFLILFLINLRCLMLLTILLLVFHEILMRRQISQCNGRMLNSIFIHLPLDSFQEVSGYVVAYKVVSVVFVEGKVGEVAATLAMVF